MTMPSAGDESSGSPDSTPADSPNRTPSRAQEIRKRVSTGISVKTRGLGEIRLKHISIGDSEGFRRILANDGLSDRRFVVEILHWQLMSPEIDLEEFGRISDDDLILIARAFICNEQYAFQFLQDTGDFLRDFRLAVKSYEEKKYQLLAQAIEPSLKAVRESVQQLARDYGPIIKEQIIEPLAAVGRFVRAVQEERLRLSQTVAEAIAAAADNYIALGRWVDQCLKPELERWQRWVAATRPVFTEVARVWVEFHQRYHIAEQRGARVLEKYKWFMTPGMPIDFLFRVVQLGETRGRHDRAMNNLFIQYFAADGWENLEAMVDSWKTSPLLKKRYKILRDCVQALKLLDRTEANAAHVILPTLVVQIEGALRDYVQQKAPACGMGYAKLKSAFRNYKPQVLTTNLDDLASDILLEILFRDTMKDGVHVRIPFYFNRHRILHGNTVRYGRTDYMIRGFMLLDLLAWLK